MNWTKIGGATHFLLRVVSGLLFFEFGPLKILGWFGGMPPGQPLTPLVATAGWIELIGGVLIFFGLFTRVAAFITSGEMAVAYFMGHFPNGFWPAQNQGVPAVLFCFIFLFLWGNGPGPWSLDGLIRSNRAREAARK